MARRGDSITEYVIILSIISAVLITMNIYMKRGLQAKMAAMSDHFISKEHVVEQDPTASVTDTVTESTQNADTQTGGGTLLSSLDDKESVATSNVEDRISPYTAPFIPAKNGIPATIPVQHSSN